MSHVFPRHTRSNYPLVTDAKGVFLYDSEGKSYLDGSGGAAVSCLGHGDPDVIDAIKSQLDKVAYAHTAYFSSPVAEQLSDLLITHAPAGMERVYLVSSGSEATEAALKLARQYFLEIGQPERHRIIARRQSYHGNTLGALAAGGNQWRREPFAPLLIDVTHISPCYAYRGQRLDETAEDYGQRVAQELEDAILESGPESVMAFIAEPVVGATLGAVPPVPGYFKRIREICDRYGVLLILDEVMCGMGRTGTLFACEQDQIAPDICTIAKGLGASYQPIGAMMCTGTIYEAIRNGTGQFQHGHTYLGHPVACAAALAVVTKLTSEGLVERCRMMGDKLMSRLQDRFGDHPNVGDIRGRGLFLGMELVADRETKTPLDPALQTHAKLKKKAFENGLICYPMGGTIDGRLGDHVLLAPPFIIEESEIEMLVDRLDASLGDVLA